MPKQCGFAGGRFGSKAAGHYRSMNSILVPTRSLNRRMGLTRMNEQVEEGLQCIGSRDHSVTAEYRIFGPPGTGKTTNLTRQIDRAVDRFGHNSVLVTSFSR